MLYYINDLDKTLPNDLCRDMRSGIILFFNINIVFAINTLFILYDVLASDCFIQLCRNSGTAISVAKRANYVLAIKILLDPLRKITQNKSM